MFDAASLVRWTAALALLLAGVRLALTGVGASKTTQRWARASAIGTAAFLALTLVLGLRRVHEEPRAEAFAPAAGVGQAPLALSMSAPLGGMKAGRRFHERWGQIGQVNGTLYKAAEMCGLFPRMPLLCIRAGQVAPSVAEQLRGAAAELGATEITDCPGGDSVAMLVSDRIDDVNDVVVPDGGSAEVTILQQKVALTVALDGAQQLTLRAGDGAKALVVPLGAAPGAPARLSLGAVHVRLRVASRRAEGALHLRIFDLHLECT